MTPEAACTVLMTCNAVSGIALLIGFLVVTIYVLKNSKNDNYDDDHEYEEDDDSYDWWM